MGSRYVNAYRLASDFLENRQVQKYWRSPKALFKKMGWELIGYSKYDNPTLSTDAYCSYKYNKFFILYCVENHDTRKVYNYHHEAGHIIAAHNIIHNSSLCKSSDTKEFLEIEATVIGRNVFFPASLPIHLIKKYGEHNTDNIKQFYSDEYGVSLDYVNVRFEYLKTDLANMIYPEWMEFEKIDESLRYDLWAMTSGNRSV